MTPGARLQETIELLDALLAEDHAADRFITRWFRRRRYAGSKDRRDIRARVYAVLRYFRQLVWWMEGDAAPRALVLAAAILTENREAAELGSLCDGSRYHPAPLSPEETERLKRLDGKSPLSPEQPVPVRCNLDDWLYDEAARSLGVAVEAELAALAAPAPVDLRVNTAKADREAAKAALAADGIETAVTEFAPLGLRLDTPMPLDPAAAYRDGRVEIQDEGSQLVAHLCGVEPGMRVLDFCAGAGGKSLALAALMENRGSIVLADVDTGRLDRAAARLARAGVDIGDMKPVAADWEKWRADEAGGFDRVLVDAPCTGAGAWRRHPEARLRLTEARFADFIRLQRDLLASASGMVKPGGRLIYATCSFFAAENEDQIDRFLAESDGFALLPADQVGREVLGDGLPGEDKYLRLSPYRHGSDGFFAAILKREG